MEIFTINWSPLRDKKHSKNHPFFELWAQGKLTKEQTAFYCTQHYHFVGEFLNWLAYQGSQIPERDVKNYLFENLGDEENPDDRHLDMLKDYVAACGVDRDSVEISIVLGAPSSCKTGAGGWCTKSPGQSRLAGMFIGLESQFLDICKKIVPGLHQHYGYKPRAREIRFFEEHIHADEIHGSKGFAIVEKYCHHAGTASARDQTSGRGDDPALALHEQYLLVRAARQSGRHADLGCIIHGCFQNRIGQPHEDSHRRRCRRGLVRRPAMRLFPMVPC